MGRRGKLTPPRLTSRYARCFADPPPPGEGEESALLRSFNYAPPSRIGGYPFVGSPDHIADELADLSRSGVRGIAFSMINYLNELPLFRDEVLPRLERLGVRAAHN